MSNIKSARQAIQAELDHARQGAAFYQSRVDALEEALKKIHDIESDALPNGKGLKNGAHAETPRKQAKPGRKPRMQAPQSEEKLPSTGKGFWPDLITEHPQSAPEILTAAIRSLGISPSKEQTKKLAQRQASALSLLTKSGEIESSGSGRERRFFKKR
jgi:hypothetical protein